MVGVPRSIDASYRTFTIVNNLKPNTQYFVRLRQFAMGKPIQEYSKLYTQSTIAFPTKSFYTTSELTSAAGVIFDLNAQASCSNIFQYIPNSKISTTRADSLFRMLLDSGITGISTATKLVLKSNPVFCTNAVKDSE